MRRVAVIGAGLSGLAARELSESSEVTVFEKSRGYGGRMATRYGGDFEFDHGAQFFTARSAEFQEFLEPLIPGVDDLEVHVGSPWVVLETTRGPPPFPSPLQTSRFLLRSPR